LTNAFPGLTRFAIAVGLVAVSVESEHASGQRHKTPNVQTHVFISMKYDPLAIPDPAAFGWTPGVDQHVTNVPDPSLNEAPLPGGPTVPRQTTTNGKEADL